MGFGPTTGINLPAKSSGLAITKFRFVTQVGAETVKQADAAGQRVTGVSQVDVSAGEAALPKALPVMVTGVSYVEASAAIAIDARVSTDLNGRAKTAIATEIPAGVAKGAAAALGDLIPVLLTPGMPAA